MTKFTDRYLINFDVLYDLRATAMAVLNPKLAEKVINDARYRARISDNLRGIWGDFPQNKWETALRELTPEQIIEHPYLTHVLAHLKQHASDIHAARESMPEGHEQYMSVTINTYPMRFSTEVREALVGMLKRHIGIDDVGTTYLTPEHTTPLQLKNNYDKYFLYSLNQWLPLHIEKLNDTPCPTCELNIPSLNHTPGVMDDAVRMGFAAHQQNQYLNGTAVVATLDAIVYSAMPIPTDKTDVKSPHPTGGETE